MQMVSKELGAALTTMSIENGKELYLVLRLLRTVRLDAWLLKVEHNRYSVLIVISDEAIMGVRTVSNHIWIQRLLRYFSFLDDGAIRELDHHFWFWFQLLLSYGNYRRKHALRRIFCSQLGAQRLIHYFVELVFLGAWELH